MVNKNGQICVNRYQQPPQRLYLKGKRKTPKLPKSHFCFFQVDDDEKDRYIYIYIYKYISIINY